MNQCVGGPCKPLRDSFQLLFSLARARRVLSPSLSLSLSISPRRWGLAKKSGLQPCCMCPVCTMMATLQDANEVVRTGKRQIKK